MNRGEQYQSVIALYWNQWGTYLFDQRFTLDPKAVRSENLRELPFYSEYLPEKRYGFVEYRYCDDLHGDFGHVAFRSATCQASEDSPEYVDTGIASNYLTYLTGGVHYTRFARVASGTGYTKYYLLQPSRLMQSLVELNVYAQNGQSLGVARVRGNPLTVFTLDDIFNTEDENDENKVPFELRRDFGWFEVACTNGAACTLCTATVDENGKPTTLHCD